MPQVLQYGPCNWYFCRKRIYVVRLFATPDFGAFVPDAFVLPCLERKTINNTLRYFATSLRQMLQDGTKPMAAVGGTTFIIGSTSLT